MTEYCIRGRVQNTAAPVAHRTIEITDYRRLLTSSTREGGGDVTVHGDELVRVKFKSSFGLWTQADDLLRERGRKTTGRAFTATSVALQT